MVREGLDLESSRSRLNAIFRRRKPAAKIETQENEPSKFPQGFTGILAKLGGTPKNTPVVPTDENSTPVNTQVKVAVDSSAVIKKKILPFPSILGRTKTPQGRDLSVEPEELPSLLPSSSTKNEEFGTPIQLTVRRMPPLPKPFQVPNFPLVPDPTDLPVSGQTWRDQTSNVEGVPLPPLSENGFVQTPGMRFATVREEPEELPTHEVPCLPEIKIPAKPAPSKKAEFRTRQIALVKKSRDYISYRCDVPLADRICGLHPKTPPPSEITHTEFTRIVSEWKIGLKTFMHKQSA